MSTIPEKCPTCGSDVLVISVDEGTSYYEPCCTDKEKYDLHMDAKKYREALANLVDLKKHKDQYGKDAEYLELQPKVWEIAFKALGA